MNDTGAPDPIPMASVGRFGISIFGDLHAEPIVVLLADGTIEPGGGRTVDEAITDLWRNAEQGAYRGPEWIAAVTLLECRRLAERVAELERDLEYLLPEKTYGRAVPDTG